MMDAWTSPRKLLQDLRTNLPAALSSALAAIATARNDGLTIADPVLAQVRVDAEDLALNGLPHLQIWVDPGGGATVHDWQSSFRDLAVALELGITYSVPAEQWAGQTAPEGAYESGWEYCTALDMALWDQIMTQATIDSAFNVRTEKMWVEQAAEGQDRWRHRARVSATVSYRVQRGVT